MGLIKKSLGLAVAFSAVTGAQVIAASALTPLDELAASSDPAALKVTINNSDRSQWRVGDSIKLHVTSNTDCNLQLIHVDANDVTSVFELGEVKAGQEAVYPQGVDFMSIEPPLGRDSVYAVCAEKKLPKLAKLRVSNRENVIEAKNLEKFAKRYTKKLPVGANISSLTYDVRGRNDELALVADDIVDFYSSRTRTIKRPKLDLNVKFDFRSAELSDNGKALLDEMGKALNNQRMAGAKFELNGHTDDIGSDSYNMSLSSKRAVAVANYLQSAHNVESERVIPKGYGESLPKVENLSDEARAENRRVEFRLIRDEF